jgi:hypothetical protein
MAVDVGPLLRDRNLAIGEAIILHILTGPYHPTPDVGLPLSILRRSANTPHFVTLVVRSPSVASEPAPVFSIELVCGNRIVGIFVAVHGLRQVETRKEHKTSQDTYR